MNDRMIALVMFLAYPAALVVLGFNAYVPTPVQHEVRSSVSDVVQHVSASDSTKGTIR